ncbi:amino acid/amide ABC transporter membrane protein 1, HAAT family [Desulfocicer vacuolatum DSM 3385]|uniref:Amino acid/amide ABC transporter membrane protein 1, HAAT family n=1 Tax=Desulfocicer vacuolatum DSM 3385 TaxID=1121400 RepID=A0A1W2D3J0_9BACT|nr:branched-chain amino acid ABC transporter permease [Desulfocicer vacuolatum]SMC91756.1 amino acid/amide ABC transporter membrane protein 1, HAAT family [Desulfocicer vacuolatum DSM 3385]
MLYFIEDTINGILMGSIYGLTALGLTIIFGVLKVINFAHGSLLMVGMYVAYWAVALSGVHPYLALVVVIPVMFLFGYLLQDIVIKPIFKAEKDVREPVTVIIVTTGVWYILDNLSLLFFGPQYRSIQDNPLRGKMFELGEMLISVPKLWGCVTALITAAGVYYFFQYTRLGRAIRATSLDRDAASLAGINQYKIYNIAFGIGTAISGIAAITLIPFYNTFPTVGVSFDIKGFIIVVLGGLGSIGGAIVGGIIVGLIESVGPQFMTATWTEAIVYGLFLLVLFVKPSGLFGEKNDW